MQDRFKFRYFNKLSNKLVEPKNWQNIDSIFECLKQQVCYDNDISLLPYNHIGNGLVFMQCTGLKDKHGKLIYEGDIVSVKVETQDFFGEDEYYSENYKGEIIFKKGEIAIDVIDTTKHPISLYYHAKDCEIVGNIYDKELLKEVKVNEKEHKFKLIDKESINGI